jgi:peptidoglycan hydrolase CwlO-like protein
MIFGAALGVLAMVADMLKTMKTNQDEILYRLKRNEVDHASALEVLDGKMEKVNGKVDKVSGVVKKLNGNIERVNGHVEETNKKEEKNYVKKEQKNYVRKETKESEGIAMFKTGKTTEDGEKKGEQERGETKGVGYYANLKAHKERMKRGY